MLKKLLKEINRQGLDMLIVVSTDEHLNEYLPPQNRRLEASTESEDKPGFTGSAGTAVFVLRDVHSFLLIHVIIYRQNKPADYTLASKNWAMKAF